MTNENWDRLKPLFANAIDLGTAERSGFVADVLNRDEQLGRQLKSLVGAYERDDFVIDRLAVPLQALRAGDVPLFSAGEVVLGRFTIVRLIGSGGMGDVYEARDGQLGRIALKAIRSCLTGDPAVLDASGARCSLPAKSAVITSAGSTSCSLCQKERGRFPRS